MLTRRPHTVTTVALVTLLAALAPATLAADSYVDAVSGSDSTGAGTLASPWRSVTHALTQISDPPAGQTHTIHLAPGLYGAATGESFPLVLRPAYQLVGDAGSAETTVDGGGVGVGLVSMRSEQAGEGLRFMRDTRVEGLTLLDARYGVHLYSDWQDVAPTLSDLVVHGMEIALFVQVDGNQGAGTSDALLQRVHFTGNGTALRAPVLGQGSTVCTVEDSFLTNNTGYGVEADGVGGSSRIVLTRTLIDSNGIDGIRTRYTNSGAVAVEAVGCSISGNLRAGYRSVLDTGLGGMASASFDRCTIASNAGAGILAKETPAMATHPTELVNCIVWGNKWDVFAGPAGANSVDVRYSNVGTGFFNDMGGNLSLHPSFWAPEVVDHHLRSDSPCIDAGDPTSPPDADGSRADMGAFPLDTDYAPLPHVYCMAAPNSVGDGALISASGNPSIAANDLTIEAEGCPPGVFALFFYGHEQIPLPLGDGYRCVGFCGCGTYRLGPPRETSPAGVAIRTVDLTRPPASAGAGAILPGSKWSFQLWYRDRQGPGGSGFNLSNAVSVWFLP